MEFGPKIQQAVDAPESLTLKELETIPKQLLDEIDRLLNEVRTNQPLLSKLLGKSPKIPPEVDKTIKRYHGAVTRMINIRDRKRKE